MTEIMILRNDVDGKTRLKKFLVDDNVLARLTKIRGNLYRDDPRLRLAKDLPTPEPVYSPEAIAATEKAVALYKMMNEAGERTRAAAMQPQPEQPKTPEEDWQTRPDIRAEFASLSSYVAYMRAQKAGRTKLYGRG